jgi:hypothetical protein
MYNQPQKFRNTPKNFTNSLEKVRNTVLCACFVVLSGIGTSYFKDNIKSFTNTLDTFGPEAAVEEVFSGLSNKNSPPIKEKNQTYTEVKDTSKEEIKNKLIDIFCKVYNVKKDSQEMFDLLGQSGLDTNRGVDSINNNGLIKIIGNRVFDGTTDEYINIQEEYSNLKKQVAEDF